MMSLRSPLFLPVVVFVVLLVTVMTVPSVQEVFVAFLNGAFGGRGHFNLFSTLGRFALILGMALSVLIAFRAGLINIGGEGQLVLGGLAAALTGIYLPVVLSESIPARGFIVASTALLAAMLTGGVWALMAGILERWGRVPLLVGSLLLNYPAVYFASYCVSHPFRDVASGATQSHRILGDARLPRFDGTILDFGVLIVGMAALLVIVIEKLSVPGYRIRLQGYSSRFAEASGFPVKKLYYQTLAISGMLAGMTGFIAVFGLNQRFIDGMLTIPLYAWTGVAAVLLAGIIPALVPVTALFFAALATGAVGMERTAGIPREVGQIVQALIILYLAGVGGRMLLRNR